MPGHVSIATPPVTRRPQMNLKPLKKLRDTDVSLFKRVTLELFDDWHWIHRTPLQGLYPGTKLRHPERLEICCPRDNKL
jgi:hypothetical protein